MDGYVYDFRGIKKKRNGYFSYNNYKGNHFFSRNPLGDLVLKTVSGRQIIKNFSHEREKELNKIYWKLSKKYGKLGYVKYNRLFKHKGAYEYIEFETSRPYEWGFDPLFQIKQGIIYKDNNEFVEKHSSLKDKYILYDVIKEGNDIYDETFRPFSSYL